MEKYPYEGKKCSRLLCVYREGEMLTRENEKTPTHYPCALMQANKFILMVNANSY